MNVFNTNKIINNSLIYIAAISIPLNIVVYFALLNSEHQFPRYIPAFLGIFFLILVFLRNKIRFYYKFITFVLLLIFSGTFNLLLGLIDTASLWFVLAIIFTLLTSKKKYALILFFISFLLITVTGILMMTDNNYLPLKYGFENCQFACVAVRIVHFLIIGFLTYYILNNFIKTTNANIKDLAAKAKDLESLNIALRKEEIEKEAIRQEMLETVILTEEKERKRIASDLHDGLGPVLSAINLYFQAYIDAKNEEKNDISIKLQKIIDTAISDVSRISHNISPHIIEKYGLIPALENFINQINISKSIEIKFTSEDISLFDLQKELAVYRAVTELINNTLKHAKADKINISAVVSDNSLIINYSDNGMGFDHNSLKSGMGLSNIKNRIQSLNGIVDIVSEIGKGMSAELKIQYKTVNEKQN